jgi:hypothetical protein
MAHELILIVEDNPKNLKLVRDTLQVKGYQTVEAETGEDGVRLARERCPALVLMDVQLTTRDNPVNFNDRLEIHADANPTSPFFGNLYVSWTLFKGSNSAAEPIVVARSTDGGLTFAKPRQLTASNNNATGGRQASQLRTGPDGTLYVFWHGARFNRDAILGARSTDGGISFTRPFVVSFLHDLPNPLPGTNFRVNSGPLVDIDGTGAV